MLDTEYSEAIVEVLDILDHSDKAVNEKIPAKLIEFFEENKSKTYKTNLDHTKTLAQMDLKNKTKLLIGMIYLNYLCDATKKEDIISILENNEIKYQQELNEKYSVDKIFKSRKNNEEDKNIRSTNLPLEIKKETLIAKIINYIKKLFMKR